MRRLTWLFSFVALALVGVAIGFRMIGHDPAIWHADPTTTERTGRPNDYVAAPAGSAITDIDMILETAELPPKELLFLFDSIARNAPRVRVVAGSLDEGHITYVQHSMIFAFPDYVSVKVVGDDGAAGLAVWSRSRFGYSDMGVNKSRVDAWLDAMGTSG